MKKILLTIILGMFLLSFASALETLGTFKQGEEIRISQVCSDAIFINISSIAYPNSSVAVSNIEMTSAGSGEFYYDFNLAQTTGEYQVRGISDGCEKTFATSFEVTIDGNTNNIEKLLVGILIIVLLFTLIIIIKNIHEKTDFDRGTKKIIESDKKKGQKMATGILYSLFKNSFVWIYSLGWFIVFILKNIVGDYSSLEFYNYFVLFANIYSLGFLLVVVYMIGYTLDYMKRMTEILTDNSWGVGDGE